MTTSKFNLDLQRGAIFEQAIGNTLARLYTGSYTSTTYSPEFGQPNGDGVLRLGDREFRCEMKAETYQSRNMCFETNGAYGRDSGLTLATGSVNVWLHYHASTDILIAANPERLINFLHDHRGKSGIRFIPQMGDGGNAAGFLAPVELITGQQWVRTWGDFSGCNWTGPYSLPPLP
jgi:hypothetical protein